jgi:type II secretory pathway component PulC
MRDDRVFFQGLVIGVLVLAGCGGGGDEHKKAAAPTPMSKAAQVKATVVAVTEPTAAPTEEPAPEPTKEPTAEPTALPTSPPEPEASVEGLELLGIVRAGASPSAVIAFDGKQEIFRKGDSVFDHGTIKDVREDSVAPTPVPEEEKPAAETVESRQPPIEAAPAPATGPLSRSEARAALRDLKNLLGKADAKRVSVGGGHGLQLGKVEPGSFFGKLGLRTGDVLQKLDGFPVEDAEHPPDLSSAAQGQELTVGFTRDEIGLTVTRPLQ